MTGRTYQPIWIDSTDGVGVGTSRIGRDSDGLRVSTLTTRRSGGGRALGGAMSATATAAPEGARPRRRRLLGQLWVWVLIAIVARHRVRPRRARRRQGGQVARRRVHPADQDRHRPGDLRHRRHRHRLARQHRPRRRPRAAGAGLLLLRDGRRARRSACSRPTSSSRARASAARSARPAARRRRSRSPRPGRRLRASSRSSPATCCRRASCSRSSTTRSSSVLVLAILTAAVDLGPPARPARAGRRRLRGRLAGRSSAIIRLIMWAAPIGAFGGMAFTVAQFGGASLSSLGCSWSRSGGRARSSSSASSGSSRG